MTKVLLVEDDKSLREIYGVRLLAEGYDIVSAGDGEEALAMAIKERPQLIVSDVMMPKISGFDMLDILRSTSETKNIKVIMMTALSSEDQRARGESLGADRYLVKSQVGIEDVVRAVHEVLGDAPVTGMSAQQMFSSPTPRPPQASPQPVQFQPAAPRPVAPVQPRPMQQPTPPVAYAQPVQSAQPAPQPVAPVMPQPSYQQPVVQPQPSGLPQPTAPFSSQRPANLGDRIIHPLERPADSQPDVSTLMNQELNTSTPQYAAAPPPPPTPQYAAPAPPMPVAPVAPPVSTSIQFEETPRVQGDQTPGQPTV